MENDTKYFLITTAYKKEPMAHYVLEVTYKEKEEQCLFYDGLNWCEQPIPNEIINEKLMEVIDMGERIFDYSSFNQYLYDLNSGDTRKLDDGVISCAVSCIM